MKTSKMDKKAIIFLGPPGSGKGTQGNLVLDLLKKDYEYFDSGKTLEKIIRDEKLAAKDPEVKKARQAFLTGKLMDPFFVLNFPKVAAESAARKNRGIIFTGSPRTILEAEGNKKNQGLLSRLEELYGRDNVVAVLLDIPVAESVKRNSKRGRPGLDESAVIKIRCQEYRKNTYPVIKSLRQRKMKVQKIDGRPAIEVVFKSVIQALKKSGLTIAKSSKIESSVKK